MRVETTEIQEWGFDYKGYYFVLVDTPGFDDSHRSNQEVTQQLLQWLAEAYREDRHLDGIIYVHSIMNPRMQGTAFQNPRMFQKLCGKNALKNVVLATSFWDQVDPDRASRREKELRESKEFWGQMIERGSRVVRLGDYKANLKLLRRMALYNPVTLKAQDEMVNRGRTAAQTSAAKMSAHDLEAEKSKYKELKDQMRKEMEAREREQDLAHQREKERLQREVEERNKLERQQKEKEERDEFARRMHGLAELAMQLQYDRWLRSRSFGRRFF
jgi:predicted GTPase